MRNVFFLFFFLSGYALNAQIVFDKSYGGLTYNRFGRSIEAANNNGYLISAYMGTGYINTVLYRINASGDTLWTRRFGNDTVQYKTYAMTRCRDGGYILCGDFQRQSTYPSMDSYIMKIDSLGHTLWFNSYGITTVQNGGKDYANNVEEMEDGSLLITGRAKHCYTDSSGIMNWGYFQGYVARFDANGNPLRIRSLVYMMQPDTQMWEYRYYTTDMAVSGTKVLVASRRYEEQSANTFNGHAVLMSSDLDTLSTISFGTGVYINSVAVTAQGSFIVFGDSLLAEIDTNGVVLWQRQCTMHSNRYTKVDVRTNGEIVLLESGDGYDISYDVHMANYQYASGTAVVHTCDASGNLICSDTLFSDMVATKGLVDFELFGDSTIAFTGGNGYLRMWTVRYEGRCHTTINIQEQRTLETPRLFPNPAGAVVTVSGAQINSEIQVCTSLGQVVQTIVVLSSSQEVEIGMLSPGYYLLRTTTQSGELLQLPLIKQ